MTTSAWVTLALTWAVVGFFAGRFFLKVLRTPMRASDEASPGEG